MSNEVLQQFYDSSSPESLQHVNLKINPQAFLDILQIEIRGFSISYSSKKKRDRLAQEVLLLQEIELFEKRIAECANDLDFDNTNQVLTRKNKNLKTCTLIKRKEHISGRKPDIKLKVKNQVAYSVH